MSDIRIRYLKFVEGQPLLFSSVATGILCGLSLCGLLVEMEKTCTPDLRLWLIVVIVRSAVRLACRLYVAWVMTDAAVLRGDVHNSSKFVDILDVFGIVWFAVGNLLVFNNFECIGVSPIVFFSSLFYICFSYLSFFAPSILRCTFGLCRPTHPDDVEYLRHTADPDRDPTAVIRNRAGGNGRGFDGVGGANREYSPDLTPERAQYWAQWLEELGCFAVSYHPSMDLQSKASRPDQTHESSATDDVDVEAGRGGAASTGTGTTGREYTYVPTDYLGADAEGDFCSVCLLAFEAQAADAPSAPPTSSTEVVEDNNIIVRYPCAGHHYFHAHCLHSWLQVASARYLNNNRMVRLEGDYRQQVTCPCCREHPRNLLNEEAPRSNAPPAPQVAPPQCRTSHTAASRMEAGRASGVEMVGTSGNSANNNSSSRNTGTSTTAEGGGGYTLVSSRANTAADDDREH